jgi:hypothetical protein
MKLWILVLALCGFLAACDRGVERPSSANEGKAVQSAAGGSANEGKAARSAAGGR